MKHDPTGRVAVNTCETGLAVVAGEITTSAHVNYDQLVRDTIRDVATTARSMATTAARARDVHGKASSRRILHGCGYRWSGDQGLMFGFACDETEELMPMPSSLPTAHATPRRCSQATKLIFSA